MFTLTYEVGGRVTCTITATDGANDCARVQSSFAIISVFIKLKQHFMKFVCN